MPEIIIQGTPIQFPDSAQSPNWAPPIIQFAEAVEIALQGVVGSADIAPQVFTMPSNANTNEAVVGLLFSTSEVRAGIIRYTVYRSTSTNSEYDVGQMFVVYNANNPTNQKWEISRHSTGNSDVTFNITDSGQVRFTTTALAGSNHVGKISFGAQTLDQV